MDLQKTNTSNNALSEKKKNSEKGQWFSLLRNISQIFFNQSIDHSLLYSLLLKNKLQQ